LRFRLRQRRVHPLPWRGDRPPRFAHTRYGGDVVVLAMDGAGALWTDRSHASGDVVRGLINVTGNSCFLNTTLQALAAVPPMHDYLRSICNLYRSLSAAIHADGEAPALPDELAVDKRALLARVEESEVHVARQLLPTLACLCYPFPSERPPSALHPRMSLGSVSAMFDDRNQHDAHELLCHLLSVIDDKEAGGVLRSMDSYVRERLATAEWGAMAAAPLAPLPPAPLHPGSLFAVTTARRSMGRSRLSTGGRCPGAAGGFSASSPSPSSGPTTPVPRRTPSRSVLVEAGSPVVAGSLSPALAPFAARHPSVVALSRRWSSTGGVDGSAGGAVGAVWDDSSTEAASQRSAAVPAAPASPSSVRSTVSATLAGAGSSRWAGGAAAAPIDNPLRGATAARTVCEACQTPPAALRALGLDAPGSDRAAPAAAGAMPDSPPAQPPWLLESFSLLSLSITAALGGRTTLQTLLARHFADDPISGYACDNPTCSHIAVARLPTGRWAVAANNARKESAIARLPPVLGVHIKRSDFAGAVFAPTVKAHGHVAFPFTLNMRPYTVEGRAVGRAGAGGAIGSVGAAPPGAAGDGYYLYDLMSVVEHQGGSLGGHYVTMRRVPANFADGDGAACHWAYCSDSDVRPISSDEVAARQAYMLFYVRRDHRVPPRAHAAVMAVPHPDSVTTFVLRSALESHSPWQLLRAVFHDALAALPTATTPSPAVADAAWARVCAAAGATPHPHARASVVTAGSGARGKPTPEGAAVRSLGGQGAALAASPGHDEAVGAVLAAFRSALARQPLSLAWYPVEWEWADGGEAGR
jgi:ubiquitin C-terminal hydrolase